MGSDAHLRSVGLADEDGAGRPITLDDQVVRVRDVVGEDRRSEGRPHTGGGDEILVGDRQSVQHTKWLSPCLPGVGLAAPAIARSSSSVTMALTTGFADSI